MFGNTGFGGLLKKTTHGTEVRKQGNKPYFRKFEGLLQRSQAAFLRALAYTFVFLQHSSAQLSREKSASIHIAVAYKQQLQPKSCIYL